jgi:hypothetical protein
MKKAFVILISFFLLTSCSDNDKSNRTDTQTIVPKTDTLIDKVKNQIPKDTFEIKIGKYSFQTFDWEYCNVKDRYKQTVKFPQRTDSVCLVDLEGNRIDTIETRDYFVFTKLMDSIPPSLLRLVMFSKIEILHKKKKLKIDRIGVEIMRPDGGNYYNNYEANIISHDSGLMDFFKASPIGSYVILDAVWFYLENGERTQESERLVWKTTKK